MTDNRTTTRRTIFIIDDDINVLNIAKASLAKHYDVVELIHPAKAISLAIEAKPYAILLDIHMPNIDGYEMLRMLKEHPFTYNIPVICVSADDSEIVGKKIIELGAIGHLKKPLDFRTLFESIEGYLNSVFSKLHDKSKNLTFYLHYNNSERDFTIANTVKESVDNNIVTYFLTWKAGSYYIEIPTIKDSIEKNKLVFLEAKNTFTSRFPYLMDLSSVFQELSSFMISQSDQSHIIVDDIKSLILNNFVEEEKMKLISLLVFLKNNFKKVTLFNTMTHNKDINRALQYLAKEFIDS